MEDNTLEIDPQNEVSDKDKILDGVQTESASTPVEVSPLSDAIYKPHNNKKGINRKTIIFLIILFLLIALTVIGYIYSRKPEKINTASTTPTITPLITPTVTKTITPNPTITSVPISIENWEVFTNQKYGFTFKHPALDPECCEVAGPVNDDSEKIISFGTETTPYASIIAIFVIPNIKSLTIEEFIVNEEKLLDEVYSDGTYGGVDEEEASAKLPIIIDGQVGYRFYGYPADLSIERIYVPFPKNDFVLSISKSEFRRGEFGNIFNSILSTFEFTD